MIPLRLNLLPPEKNHYLGHMVRFQFIKNILEILLIISCLIGMVFLGGESVLQSYFNDLTEQITSINYQYAETNQEIIKINKTVSLTEKIQKEYTLWTKKLADLTYAVPESITLNSLTLDQKNKTIAFVGQAPSREALLQFKEAIEKITWVSSLDIPLSQLTNKQNIPFSLTAKIR